MFARRSIPASRLVLDCTSILVALVASGAALAQGTQPIVTASSAFGGGPSNGHSAQPYLSPDGRWLGFITAATDVVAGDSNGAIWDVVLVDRTNGARQIAMRNLFGAQPDGDCFSPRVSDDGRYVSCLSIAANLAFGDTNGTYDYFVRDLTTGNVERATLGASGSEPSYVLTAGISPNGRVVAFVSDDPTLVPGDTGSFFDVFVRDLDASTTVRVEAFGGGDPDADSFYLGGLSADGRYVLFSSYASNLVAGDTNGAEDVFLFDRTNGAREVLSVDPAGTPVGASAEYAALTRDARFVSFSGPDALVVGDVNGAFDVVLRDRSIGVTSLVSLGNGGVPADFGGYEPSLSSDARYVTFTSISSTLTANAPSTHSMNRAYFRDRQLGTTTMLDVSSIGEISASGAAQSVISGDGRVIAFTADDADLAPDAALGFNSVFLRDFSVPQGPVAYCTAKTNSLGCTPSLSFSGTPSASAGSGFVVQVGSVLNQKLGLLAYSLSGPRGVPFAGGVLCLDTPLVRGVLQSSGGSLPPTHDCSGSYSVDFNAHIASGSDPELQAGEFVWCQQWSRDSGFTPPNSVGLSSALWFWIAP
ncbi:MAG: hypothetical protein L6Q99_08570 [Planctomycetes bacterium]|nr:hypothetical protein [Planctomycetota bacterium]